MGGRLPRLAGGQEAPLLTKIGAFEPEQRLPIVAPLLNNLLGYLNALPAAERTSPSARDAFELARSLLTTLPKTQAEPIEQRFQDLEVRAIAIGTVPHRMIFDKELVAVEAVKPVEFHFSNSEWTFDDWAAETIPLPGGRSSEVGRELFKVAACVSCHELVGEGRVFGPDLAKLDERKHSAAYILQAILEPSHEIDKKFQT